MRGWKFYTLIVVDSLLGAYALVIIARSVMSFFAYTTTNATFQRIYSIFVALTEPLLLPVRTLLRKVPFLANLPIDFSPVVLLLLISFVRSLLSWL